MIKKYEGTPLVSVGIVGAESITFTLNGYGEDGSSRTATIHNGLIQYDGKAHTRLCFKPQSPDDSFSLMDVVIGVNFHWQRLETQTFRGSLRLLADGGKIWAINDLPVEDYLESVISSEMSAQSSLPLLMAHAVISRSWLMSQIDGNTAPNTQASHGDAFIRWYDHTDHTLFDVCADDHCQRYQGITKETSPNVAEAIRRTRGELLTYGDEICDARFSKCCGGAMEEFQYCWDDTPKPYLKGIGDTPEETIPDLTVEENARQWILSSPKSFCNTTDKRILSQVLNDYDQETTDFYRWRVSYTQEELSKLVEKKLGAGLGTITDMRPLKRGTSGRICELRITGTKKTIVVGKELEIRRALSESHLYSSAFVVEKQGDTFTLIGAGWGHGVGLCQIGAAVMGDKGYAYDEILRHYYPGAEIEKAW
ncbi:MAG: SpoIID/LytB domain-containing protein [Prevotella sp.]|uniref:SpoIID/LytB domain-containing protein n=2 Tax=Prevotella sp. TaxID=59823 RepID=UPI0040289535|nr:SpoIID/LytB domain-containing protein [Prevotella sp.]